MNIYHRMQRRTESASRTSAPVAKKPNERLDNATLCSTGSVCGPERPHVACKAVPDSNILSFVGRGALFLTSMDSPARLSP